MKLTLSLAQQVNTPNGPARLSLTYEDVKEYRFTEEGRVLVVELGNGGTVVFNWALVFNVEVDPFGSIVHGGEALNAASSPGTDGGKAFSGIVNG